MLFKCKGKLAVSSKIRNDYGEEGIIGAGMAVIRRKEAGLVQQKGPDRQMVVTLLTA
jgi:hypothetical protein